MQLILKRTKHKHKPPKQNPTMTKNYAQKTETDSTPTLDYSIKRYKNGCLRVTNIQATIFLQEGKSKIKAGNIDCVKISGIRGESFKDIIETLHEESKYVAECFAKCFKPDPKCGIRFYDDSMDFYDDLNDEFLYIKEIRINKNERNSGIGTLAIHCLVEDFGASAIVSTLPFAFEDHDNEKAHQRVEKFWSKIGFKQLSKKESYFVADGFEIYENVCEKVYQD